MKQCVKCLMPDTRPGSQFDEHGSPVAIAYRGDDDRLYKRDFAGEMLDKYNDLRLIDYGFSYRRDAAFPQDDITWFLLEKTNT